MAYTEQQKRSHIRELQTMLYAISFENPAIPRVIPDGIYGESTADAVRAFQQHYGLRVTGEVSSLTWEKIAEVYLALEKSSPIPLEAFPPVRHAVIVPGAHGLTVLVIQSILHALSEQFDDIPDCPVTGTFDADTVRAVQPFQKLCGLPVTGSVDCQTWNMLAQAGDEMRNEE